MKDQSKKMFAGIVLAGSLMLSGMYASAAVLIEWQDGDGEAFTDWASEARIGGGAATDTIAANTLGGETAMTVAPNLGVVVPPQDVHFTTAAPLISTGNFGAWGPDADMVIGGMQFDFYAGSDGSAGAPVGLGFYFADTGGHVWYYDIDPAYVNDGWNTYSVGFDYDYAAYGNTGWYGYTDDSHSTALAGGDFTTDLTTDGAIDQLGFWIAYPTSNSTQNWGVDNFGLTVPEPETYLILGMALLSVAIVFRKRISESLAEARAMMQV